MEIKNTWKFITKGITEGEPVRGWELIKLMTLIILPHLFLFF